MSSHLHCCQSTGRRKFLKLAAALPLLSAFQLGCKRPYKRPAGDHNLGAVQDLLYGKQIVRDRQMLVTRDQKGWAAMSTQCSYDGCALSYQDQHFICMCCGSVFDHDGNTVSGPAKEPLPFFKIRYADGNLYADSGVPVRKEERFTTPEIEQAIGMLSERIKKEGARPGARIPDILLGNGDGEETGPMFQERLATPSTLSPPQ